MTTDNKYTFGQGIYTIPEIASILKIPYRKANIWVNKYWDGFLGSIYGKEYSWKIQNKKAVNFQTLVEFYILYQLGLARVKPGEVVKAHIELSKLFKVTHPFAQKEIIQNIRTDGKKFFIKFKEVNLTLDGSKQLNLDLIDVFFKNLEFNKDFVAIRFWPLGKNKNIVVDPNRQFGHPVIEKTNIFPETLYSMYKAGDNVKLIASLFEIDEKSVLDAISYCEAA